MTLKKQQLAFHFDSGACSGCKACQMACRDRHDLDRNGLWRRVYEVTGGEWRPSGTVWVPEVFAYNLSIACNHCLEPVCRDVCPAAAIRKRRDGIVWIDADRCLGCRYCEWACPYGAPRFDERAGVMTKCHFCMDAVDRGGKPACVEACPMRALDFGTLEDLKARHSEAAQPFPLPDPDLTKPALLITPHRDAKRAGPRTASVANAEEVGYPRK